MSREGGVASFRAISGGACGNAFGRAKLYWHGLANTAIVHYGGKEVDLPRAGSDHG